ncbi:MAG TPA: zinc ribbon domain-containing protein, partial [Acidiferrobacterales bacterium]|nr:zinc ribbon domain-containing protein [Acidiferrobacterales bacterium]
MNKFCQSCGMPMKKDLQRGGTDSDGSRSSEYCSYCYVSGAFTSPEIDTPQAMQRFCIGKLKEMG